MLNLQSIASFTRAIERLVQSEEMNYVEAIAHYMQVNHLEAETVIKLMNNTIKNKLEEDATRLNLIHRGKKRLV